MARVLRGTVKIVFADPESIADKYNPTSVELNNATFVHDVSCALLDDYELNQTESDTDDARTICDIGQVSNPTDYNYTIDLTALMDKDQGANGAFNRFRDLVRAPDVKYLIYKRIGPAQSANFAQGQYVSLYGGITDYPVVNVDQTAPMTLQAVMKPTGEYKQNIQIAS